VTTALKFLRPGRRGAFTGVRWPEPGAWLESSGEPELCRAGIHALRPAALPYWLAEELWYLELEDARDAAPGLMVARRGRLLERVGEWDDHTARDFAEGCLRALPRPGSSGIARERASDAVQAARDVSAGPAVAAVAYIAAKAAEADRPGGYEEERVRQEAWLRTRLSLDSSA